jgi:hypothetical protein
MKLDPTKIAVEQLATVTLKLPLSVIAAIDHAASRADMAVPNRSAFVRSAVIRALLASQRKTEKEAA